MDLMDGMESHGVLFVQTGFFDLAIVLFQGLENLTLAFSNAWKRCAARAEMQCELAFDMGRGIIYLRAVSPLGV